MHRYQEQETKRNVQKKFRQVGPLEDSAGNIISQGCFNGGRLKWILGCITEADQVDCAVVAKA